MQSNITHIAQEAAEASFAMNPQNAAQPIKALAVAGS